MFCTLSLLTSLDAAFAEEGEKLLLSLIDFNVVLDIS